MKTIILLTVLLLLLVVGLGWSQTNPPPAPVATPVLTAQQTWAALVAEDARKLVFDLLSGISWSGLGSAVLFVYLGAKGLRNYAPLNSTGRLAAVLNLLNLERPTPKVEQRSNEGTKASTQ